MLQCVPGSPLPLPSNCRVGEAASQEIKRFFFESSRVSLLLDSTAPGEFLSTPSNPLGSSLDVLRHAPFPFTGALLQRLAAVQPITAATRPRSSLVKLIASPCSPTCPLNTALLLHLLRGRYCRPAVRLRAPLLMPMPHHIHITRHLVAPSAPCQQPCSHVAPSTPRGFTRGQTRTQV